MEEAEHAQLVALQIGGTLCAVDGVGGTGSDAYVLVLRLLIADPWSREREACRSMLGHRYGHQTTVRDYR